MMKLFIISCILLIANAQTEQGLWKAETAVASDSNIEELKAASEETAVGPPGRIPWAQCPTCRKTAAQKARERASKEEKKSDELYRFEQDKNGCRSPRGEGDQVYLGSYVEPDECYSLAKNNNLCGLGFSVDFGNHNWCGCGRKGTPNANCDLDTEPYGLTSKRYLIIDQSEIAVASESDV